MSNLRSTGLKESPYFQGSRNGNPGLEVAAPLGHSALREIKLDTASAAAV